MGKKSIDRLYRGSPRKRNRRSNCTAKPTIVKPQSVLFRHYRPFWCFSLGIDLISHFVYRRAFPRQGYLGLLRPRLLLVGYCFSKQVKSHLGRTGWGDRCELKTTGQNSHDTPTCVAKRLTVGFTAYDWLNFSGEIRVRCSHVASCSNVPTTP